MANEQNLRPPWKPGQSGNPAGYSRKRRIQDAIGRLLDELGDDRSVALAIYAMATGRKSLLKDKDEEDGKRSPHFIWWRELIDRVDGPINPASPDESLEEPPPLDEHGNPITP